MDSDHQLTLFISDLHLEADRPEVIELFLSFLHHYGQRASKLYILGDFFEVWIGDDVDTPLIRQVSEALRALAGSDVSVYLMVGNRDFLIGDRFASASGCELLPDPTLIDLYGTPTLLLHGDSLCIDDSEYQAFRRQVRGAAWQRRFLSQPIEARAGIARDLREKSQERSRDKSQAIMDVHQGKVERVMRDRGVTQLIHGHTHRPACHTFNLDNEPVQRWVLGDWNDSAKVLVCGPQGNRLLDFSTDIPRTNVNPYEFQSTDP